MLEERRSVESVAIITVATGGAMKLYLVRHGEAVEKSEMISEPHRYLTSHGRDCFRITARTVAKEVVAPDCILTSPLVRAVQTAEILAETLAFTGPLRVAEELAPGFDRRGLDLLLDRCFPASELVLVGHEPDMGFLVASLLGRRGSYPLKKGGVAALEFEPMQGTPATFRWMAILDEVTNFPVGAE